MVKKILKVVLLLSCIIALITMIYIVYLRVNAVSIGENSGTKIGYLVGRAMGSFDGMTQGSIEGWEAGKTAGLSAEDTVANIESKIQQMYRLEVLVASVKLSDVHQIGETKVQYAALYLANGNMVFSVDMSRAIVKYSGDTMHILLPQPQGQLFIDASTIEKVADYQRTFFCGKAEDGYDAYLNTMAQMSTVSADTINGYDHMIDEAKKSAEKQIMIIANSASKNFRNIVIDWCE